MDVEGCRRLSVHDGFLEVGWFCVCTLGGSLAREMNVSFVVVVCASASASALGDRLGDRIICVEVV